MAKMREANTAIYEDTSENVFKNMKSRTSFVLKEKSSHFEYLLN